MIKLFKPEIDCIGLYTVYILLYNKEYYIRGCLQGTFNHDKVSKSLPLYDIARLKRPAIHIVYSVI